MGHRGRPKAEEPRTYIRVPLSWAKMVTRDSEKQGLSVPEYVKNKKLVIAEEISDGMSDLDVPA